MNKESFINGLQKIVGSNNLKIDEPMKKHITFKVGGKADFLIMPTSKVEILEIIELCQLNKVPFYILGNGSNLIVTDKGIEGVVIKIASNFNSIRIKDNEIIANAGALIATIAQKALNEGLTGFEFAAGIPGTLGGAVVMNAGAYGREMKDVVLETEYITFDGKVKVIKNDEHEFAYRTSRIQKENGIVISSKILLNRGDKQKIKEYMLELSARRREKQPLEFPSAGSIFKRPEGYFVGKLIEDAGLKGYTIGGAQISKKHSGFIVNIGGATAGDIIELIDYVKEKIKEKYDIKLETEVKIIGKK